MASKLPQPFGKYILLNKIALGGMAEIFRAKTIGAEGFEKEVVIKRILPHYTEDEAFVTMFIDEAKVSSSLNHPNIVQIYDFDLCEDTYYIAMEYIEGKDLKRLMDQGVKDGNPMTVPQCVHVIMETCKGLHYAHTKSTRGEPLNIIHRDVSPHNVMVSYGGACKVMDFGIAKAAARSTKTRAGTVKGKCAYMSPEQARGKNLDPRSDMFAVGVMFWEMLTHKRLFAGESDFETLSNVLKADVPPPSSLNADVPPEIDEIILKCLSKDRDDRQDDCKGLQRELEKWFYTNVEDRDAAELGPFMRSMFAEDIAALREMQQADQKTQALTAGEMARANRSASQTAMPRTLSSQSNPQVSANEAKTMAIDVAKAQALLNSDATVAVDPSATGLQKEGTKSKGGLYAVMALLVLGLIGGGAWWFMQTPDKPAASNSDGTTTGVAQATSSTTGVGEQTTASDPPPGTDSNGTTSGQGGQTTAEATDTGAAETTGAAATGDDPTTGDATTAEATGGDTTGGETTGSETTGGETTGSETTGDTSAADTGGETTGAASTGDALPGKAKVVFTAIPADAVIQVRGQKGTGRLEIEANVGDELAVIVTHPEYKQIVKTVKVDSAAKAVDVPLTEKKIVEVAAALAVLEFTVTPTTAKLLINGQMQPMMSPGVFKIQGYKVGEDVSIVVSAPSHVAQTDRLRITASQFQKAYTLKRKPTEARGPGKVRFKAKPWAKVTVKGKSCTTNCSMELMSGRYVAMFSQAGKTKRKPFRIRAGKTVTVFQDMTK